MRRPAFQFYPADWRKDNELQSCSIGARGLWHEMMCLMHEAEPYGHLVLNGRAMTEAQVSRACGVSPQQYRTLLAELKAAGVPSETDQGVIFSRRMVRDERLRAVRAEAGKLGGNPSLVGKKDMAEVRGKVKQIPTPSSSSSSSEKTKGAFAPPEWVPIEPWKAWLEVRRKKRTPNTDHALQLAVAKLDELRAAGHDPKAVLEQSTLRGWQGLFEVKPTTPSAVVPIGNAIGNCPCGSPGTVKVGGKPRCAAHVRELPEAA